MMKQTILLSVIGATFLFNNLVSAENLVKNGNFTNELSGWKSAKKTELFIEKKGEKAALKLVAQNPEKCFVAQYFKSVIFEKNTKYKISFEVKTIKIKSKSGKGGACVNLRLSKKWSKLYPKPLVTGDNNWTMHEHIFTVPDETMKTPYIRLRIQDATGTAMFRNIKIEKMKS